METTINELFANTATRYANRPALLEPVQDDEIVCLTYGMLQQKIHDFCGYLQEQHLQKGDRLLLWAPSRINWMISYLGALLTGAVIVPLDVNSRPEFLAKIADVTGAKFLITSQKDYEKLPQPGPPLIDIDALPSGLFDPSQLPVVTGHDLAELVFTSGTTGQPKGVMLSHNNIASNAIAAVSVVRIRNDDRALSLLPLSHMFELTIEVAIFYTGASVVYARTLAPDRLLKLLATQHVTCMVLVPQALQLFMNGIEREVRRQKREKQWEMLHRVAPYLPFRLRRLPFNSVHKRFGGHFRFFVSGGAYLPPKLARRWENMGFRVMQGYGATECAPVVSVTPYNEHNYDSIGKPLPGEEVRIAEDGELLVHGPNVALGYWQNPEATAAAFQDGWYHTGDLGYQDKNGNLYLKGRKKNLIVLANGLNVYPEDIENVLLTNPLIKDAVVVGLMEENDGPTVHAILLLNEPEKAKAVIAQANKQLAPHQQIRGFTIWPEEDFPRTHTLKVKRPEVLDKLQLIRKGIRAES
ncbi:MAG TPA: AMP-binding protein [Ktedonobacteraceae bacterium]|nr:AMP-binding protein [Ktedonobacteraceae bacterium]